MARGFAGIEILLSVLVLVAGVCLAFSIGHRIRQRLRCENFVAEVRAISAALERRHHDLGKWPGAAMEGVAPEGVAAFLAENKWPAITAIGGRYTWTPPLHGEPAMLGVTAFGSDGPLTVSRADLRAIDAVLDDGNLATGRFRTGFNDWPVWTFSP